MPDTHDDAGERKTRVRRLLQGLGGASAAGLAGCLGDEDDDPDDEPDDDEEAVDDEPDDDPDDEPDDDEEEVDDDTDRWHRDHDWEGDEEAATDWDNYEEHHVLDVEDIASDGELMSIAADPEGRIWYIDRGAPFITHGDDTCEVGYVDPEEEEHTVALELDVVVSGAEVGDAGDLDDDDGAARELGGQAVAIDPDFEENGYVYVWYHPASDDLELIDNPYHEDITTANQLVSRFEFGGEELDPDSEEVIIEIPFQLDTCCHYGCYLEFGPEGHLWLSTGDDSNNVGNPDEEVNWSMTDERDGEVHGRPAAVADAQRTSGNTADLRGSILRITPTEDGEDGEMYEVPDGNLKDHWEAETGEEYDEEEFHPEIYALGFRNPFVFSVDSHTGFVFTGNYGNDADSVDPDLGMMGIADYHLLDEPANAGYPYFRGFYPYAHYDFEEEEPGQPFWFDNLRNRSPNNTGIENIPNVTPAILWHPQTFEGYDDPPVWMDQPRRGEITWPELDEGGSADATLIYRYDDDFEDAALDPYYEGKLFFTNPSNADVIRYLTLNDDGSVEIDEFLPENDIAAAYDMDLLPDGRLVVMGMYSGIHVIEYDG